MSAAKKRIGLMGGTFDPVHYGHIAIAHSFMKSGYLDELWILLTPDPPHKQNQALSDYEARLELLKRAFSEAEKIKLSSVENSLPRPTYTLQTVRHLKETYPEYRFYLCIGSDSMAKFSSWYRYREILQLVELLVARRPGEKPSTDDAEIAENSTFIGHEPVNISSTEIRERIGRGEAIDELVPHQVEEHILEKALYR